MTSRLAKLSLLLVVVLMVGCDHATKHAAVQLLSSRRPVELVPGVLDLRYAENHDTAFSMLQRLGVSGGGSLLLATVTVITIALAVVWYRRRRLASRLEHLGYGLALAGAIGNLADRLVRGFVVDFIHVRHWPVFNVADIAIVLGMAFLAWIHLRDQARPAPT